MPKVNFKGGALLNPVPTVLVTSINSKGETNVFTVGWVGTVCTKPPMLSISIRPERLSYAFIKESMEFTVNLPSRDLVKSVDFCGVRSGKNIDKIKACNFTLEKASTINTPSIAECPISLECKVKQIIPLGSHDLFIADVVSVNVENSLIDSKGKIHFESANLISYNHGEYFSLSKKAIGKFGFSVKKKR